MVRMSSRMRFPSGIGRRILASNLPPIGVFSHQVEKEGSAVLCRLMSGKAYSMTLGSNVNRRTLSFTFILCCIFGVGVLAHAQTQVLFADDFSQGTSLWPETFGTWIESQDGLQSDERYASELVGGHPDWQDVTFEVAFELYRPLVGNDNIKLLFRWQGQWHGYGLLLDASGTRLVRWEGGARQFQMLAQSAFVPQPGEMTRVRVDMQGRRMTAYVNDTPILQGMDPVHTHKAGQVGIRTESAPILLHSVRVTGPEDAPVLDASWMDGQSALDRILNGFPSADTWQGPGYHPPATEAAAGARDIMLIYTHGTTSWHMTDALPYVGYGEMKRDIGSLPRLEWYDWFFDTFLFLSLRTADGQRDYGIGHDVTWRDWLDFLDQVFTQGMYIDAFDEATGRIKADLGDSNYRAKVIVMIPYPHPSQTNFGDPEGAGRSLSFNPAEQGEEAALQARASAIAAYIDEFLVRWEAEQFEHLEFIGFYWLAESLSSPGDAELVRQTADLVHERGYKMFWIPHFEAQGLDKWHEIGFDVVILQPNYMFNDRLPRNRLLDAAQRAYALGLGVEIEADRSVLSSASGRERYRDYLWAGVKYGYMENAIHAYYQEIDLLGRAFFSTDPEVRALYDDTYLFLKGRLIEKVEDGE